MSSSATTSTSNPSVISAMFGEISTVARATAAVVMGLFRGHDRQAGAHIVPDIGEKVDGTRHLAQPWRLHTLAPDFKLLDVWALPIVADPAKGETFHEFFKLARANGLDTGSQVGRFFSWFRSVLGDVFHWEYDASEQNVAGTKNERSITERLTAEDRRTNRETGDGTPTVKNSITKLALVYERENDALFEIHNKTVSALFHLSFVDTADGKKTPELAVYVKERGFKSKLYLGMIEPFRLVAIYPQWISHMAKKWEEQKHNIVVAQPERASQRPQQRAPHAPTA